MRIRGQHAAGQACTVMHSNARTDSWADCECGWRGPLRKGTDKGKAYDDQDAHLSKGTHNWSRTV